jgi:hypothetical protein
MFSQKHFEIVDCPVAEANNCEPRISIMLPKRYEKVLFAGLSLIQSYFGRLHYDMTHGLREQDHYSDLIELNRVADQLKRSINSLIIKRNRELMRNTGSCSPDPMKDYHALRIKFNSLFSEWSGHREDPPDDWEDPDEGYDDEGRYYDD